MESTEHGGEGAEAPSLESQLRAEKQKFKVYEKKVQLWKEKVKELNMKDRERIQQLEDALKAKSETDPKCESIAVTALQRELEEKQEALRKKTEEHDQLMATMLAQQQRFTEAINDSDQKCRNLQDELSSWKQGGGAPAPPHDACPDRIHTLEELNRTLQGKLEECEAKYNLLTEQQRAWKAKAVALTTRDRQLIQELQSQVSSLTEAAAQKAEKPSSTSSASSTARLIEMKSKIVELEAKLADTQAQHETQLVDLEAKLAEVTQERDDQQAVIQAQLIETTHQCNTQIGKLQDKLATLKSKRESLGAAAAAAEAQVTSLREQVERLTSERDRLTEHLKQQLESVMAEHAELMKLQTDGEGGGEEMSWLHQQFEKASAEHDNLFAVQQLRKVGMETVAALKKKLESVVAERNKLAALSTASDATDTETHQQGGGESLHVVAAAEVPDNETEEWRRQSEALILEKDRRIASQQDSTKHNNEMDVLRRELEKATEECFQAKELASLTGAELEGLRKQLEDAVADRDNLIALQQNNSSAKAEAAQLQSQLDDLRAQHDLQRAELRARLTSVEDERDQLATASEAKDAQIAELQERLTATAAERDQEASDLRRKLFEMTAERDQLVAAAQTTESHMTELKDELTATIAAKDASASDLQRKLCEATAERDHLAAAASASDKARDELRRELEKATEECFQAKELASLTGAELEGLRKQLEDAVADRDNLIALQQNNSSAKAEAAQLQSQLDDLRAQHDLQRAELRARLTSVEAERDQLATASEAKDAQIAELQERLTATAAERDQEASDLRRKLFEMTAERDQLVAAAQTTESHMTELKDELTALRKETETQVEELHLKLKRVIAERDQLVAEASTSLAKLAELQAKVSEGSNREQRIVELEAMVQQIGAEREALQIAARDAESRYTSANDLLTERSAEMERLNSRSRAAEAEAADLQDKVERLMAQEGEMVSKVATAESELLLLRESIGLLEGKLAAEMEASAKAQEAAEERLAAVTAVSEGRREKLEQLQDKMAVWKEKVLARVQAESQKVAATQGVLKLVADAFRRLIAALVQLEVAAPHETPGETGEKSVPPQTELMKLLGDHEPDSYAQALTGLEGEDLAACLNSEVERARQLVSSVCLAVQELQESNETRRRKAEEALAEKEQQLEAAARRANESAQACRRMQEDLDALSAAQEEIEQRLEHENEAKLQEALRKATEDMAQREAQHQRETEKIEMAHKAHLHQLEQRCSLLKKEVLKLKRIVESSQQLTSPVGTAGSSASFSAGDAAQVSLTQIPPRPASYMAEEQRPAAPTTESAEEGNRDCGVEAALTSNAYMRNVIYQFLSSAADLRVKMIPAIVTVLGFTSLEKRAIAAANPSCPPLR